MVTAGAFSPSVPVAMLSTRSAALLTCSTGFRSVRSLVSTRRMLSGAVSNQAIAGIGEAIDAVATVPSMASSSTAAPSGSGMPRAFSARTTGASTRRPSIATTTGSRKPRAR